MKTDRLVVEVGEELKSDFKEAVESQGKTMKYVISNFLKRFISGKDNEKSGFDTSDISLKVISDLHGSKSEGITKAIEAYIHIRPSIIKSIERKLEANDIAILSQALRSSIPDPVYMNSVNILHNKIVMEADKPDIDKSTESSLMILSEKIKSFTPAECYVLQEEVYRRIL